MPDKITQGEISRRIKTFVILILFIFIVGIAGFMVFDKVSFQNALIKTLSSLAFMFEEEAGATKILQILLAIFGVMTLAWIIGNSFEMFFSGRLSEYLKTKKFLSNMKKMRNHYIIAGGGRVGEELAKSFAKDKKNYIIIEKDSARISKLKNKGFIAIQGDVADSDASDLLEAGIKNAKAIILALPETEKNLLVTMTVKELNPSIEVYARADNPAFVEKLKKAGAKIVINPEVAAAEKFLKSIR